ncbi:hypothetical protein, partial [Acidocella aquatica]|uniref:hypothetical protein n=1 Tax=Acidocella aquatica TaxID=1922313 RepID=UPI0024E08286
CLKTGNHIPYLPGRRAVEHRLRSAGGDEAKTAAGLVTLTARPETRREFFMSLLFPGNQPRPQFERDGVQVWSIDM